MKNNIKDQNVFFHPNEIPEGVNRIFPGDGHLLESFTFSDTEEQKMGNIDISHFHFGRNIQLLWPCERFICDGHREMLGSHNDRLSTAKVSVAGDYSIAAPHPLSGP